MTINLQNRRYIGNKFKLLSFIDNVLKKENISFETVADIFAGTGVVSCFFLEQRKKLIINDILFSNQVFYQAWLSGDDYNDNKVSKLINYYNKSSDYLQDNYFSETFSNTYYSFEDALKIGSIREHLEKNKESLTKREYFIILASLLYAADKIANTVGHFESFLKSPPKENGVFLEALNIKNYKYKPEIYQQNANLLIKNIKSDLLYIDPPYNARQYANFYHILENLAEWNKPPVFGKTLKMPRKEKMSLYSTASAKKQLQELVSLANTKYILLSYNNTYTAESTASINKISEMDIYDILTKKGSVKIFDTQYRFFNTGKTYFTNHKELLYLCSCTS